VGPVADHERSKGGLRLPAAAGARIPI